jgi:arylsulfatase
MLSDESSKSPQEAYFIYYNNNELQAVVMDEWKLYFPHRYRTLAPNQEVRNDGIPMDYKMVDLEERQLYHLPSDVSEATNLIDQNPEVLKKMMDLAALAREDMGDALTNNKGKNRREPGRVQD